MEIFILILLKNNKLGMPETSLRGRSTRTARNVRKSIEVFFLILIVAKLKIRKRMMMKNKAKKNFC